jgi:hypothetical protein
LFNQVDELIGKLGFNKKWFVLPVQGRSKWTVLDFPNLIWNLA